MISISDGFIERLKDAKKVAVLTGAGISAESEVPTFRGKDGLWKKFSPMELANFDAFIQNPKLVWEWYNWRRGLINDVEPNPGHYALAKMEEIAPEFTLITQNVDGLHKRAGSKNILELHGRIYESFCIDCQKRYDEPEFEDGVPRCECGGLVRPDVVWFGESLDPEIIDKAFRTSATCEVFLSVGTSAQVQPAASLPVIAKQSGAYVVEINPEDTPITHMMDEFMQGPSGEVLPAIVEKLEKG
jgi:NAD-dependent deacetylase